MFTTHITKSKHNVFVFLVLLFFATVLAVSTLTVLLNPSVAYAVTCSVPPNSSYQDAQITFKKVTLSGDQNTITIETRYTPEIYCNNSDALLSKGRGVHIDPTGTTQSTIYNGGAVPPVQTYITNRNISSLANGTYQVTHRALGNFGSPDVSNSSFVIDNRGPQVQQLGVNFFGSCSGGAASSVSFSPAPNSGGNCSSNCNRNFNQGTFITMTANPATGCVLDHWTDVTLGGDRTANPTNLTLNSNRVFDVWFETAECGDGIDNDGDGLIDDADAGCASGNNEFNVWYMLSVAKNPPAGGTITISAIPRSKPGDGISCGNNCSEEYDDGVNIILYPGTAPGYTFTGWTGDNDCNDGNVFMNAHHTCTANYTPTSGGPYTLTVNVIGGGEVDSTSPDNGILDCRASSGDCTEDYADGTSVILTGALDPNYTFGGISGTGCTNAATTGVPMTQDRTCTVTFNPSGMCTGTVDVTSDSGTGWTVAYSGGSVTEPGPSTSKTYNGVLGDKTYTLTPNDEPGVSESVGPANPQLLTCGGTINFNITHEAEGGGGVCGDGNIDAGEACDDGVGFNDACPASCTLSCTINNCGGGGGNPECSDGVDNDGDGVIDFPNDPGCQDEDDDDERNSDPQCSDTVDNDGDLKIDINDPGCHTDGDAGNSGSYDPDDNDESDAECSDGIDNDGDGETDYPDDLECTGPTDESERRDLQFEEF